ncbi:alpha/beta fold hydrolase [Roseivirga sp. BDSF3-8]|uniref:bifunctional alpha/beta hydrolase/OsmC family protein n=1 Tax=Roseivirga sp. BDSF3-8 TaxID=3241598 RepID=UPI0035327B67
MKTIRINFINKDGHELSGRLEMPVNGQPDAYAVFAHCFTCNKNFKAVTNICRSLTQQKIAVLRFDFTGLGNSEGNFADTTFSGNTEDLVSAATYLQDHYEAPQLLIGHSLGGAAVLVAAARLDSVKALVTIGAPSDPEHVTRLIGKEKDKILQEGAARVSIAGRHFSIKKQFLDDLEEYRMKDRIRKLGKALLIMHSPQDRVVEIVNAEKIYNYSMHPKSFISLDGADHLLSDEQDSRYAGYVLAAWALRYLEPKTPEDLETDSQTVTSTGNEGFLTEIQSDQHSFMADEPVSVGGTDLGPTPYDLLTASLGACTGMTLRMYADRKGLNLEEVRVHVQHAHKHADDCTECQKPGSRIDQITRKIELIGELNEEEKKKLLEIADKCPVHRTMSSQTTIHTELIK